MSPTAEELVAKIEAIDASDPEAAHDELDDLLLEFAGPTVQAAAASLIGRCAWWAMA